MAKIRIQKALSDAGALSRRKAEQYIAEGRITVNGRPAQTGHAIDPARDVIAIDGQRVVFKRHKENVYIMLNKPRGFVTTTSDELGRRCVTELVEDVGTRVYPVGRLDKNSEGLLLLTNDGQFANMMMHPRSHVSKTYRLTVRPDANEDQLVKLATGVQIDEDLVTLPANVLVLEREPGRSVLQITITEGKNRQLRRMCEAVGLEVARLRRISVGPLKLGMLQPGKWRALTKAEVIALRNAGTPSEEPQEHTATSAGGSDGRRPTRSVRQRTQGGRPDTGKTAARTQGGGRPSTGNGGTRRTQITAKPAAQRSHSAAGAKKPNCR